MTVLESLKNRGGLIVSRVASFIVVIGGMRLAAGQPLVHPHADVGILVGIAMGALILNSEGKPISCSRNF